MKSVIISFVVSADWVPPDVIFSSVSGKDDLQTTIRTAEPTFARIVAQAVHKGKKKGYPVDLIAEAFHTPLIIYAYVP